MSYLYGGFYVPRNHDEGIREVEAYRCQSWHSEQTRDSHDHLVRLMAVHLHEDHKLGVRAIAKRLGMKMVQVKKLLASHPSGPEDD